MERSVLISGCNGFVGQYLARHLKQEGFNILGVGIQDSAWAPWIDYRKVDISDSSALERATEHWHFEHLYHLAAVANPRVAAREPFEAVRANVLGTTSLLELARRNPSVRVLLVGTSEVYRPKRRHHRGYREDDPLQPRTLYAATKLAAEVLGSGYARNYGMSIYFTRSFNHLGAGQLPDYVLSDFARQCAEIRKGKRKPIIMTGNIGVARDFTDVRDVVRAYGLILARGQRGEVYNVCSGRVQRLDALLKHLARLTGRNDVTVETEPSRVRANEEPRVFGSNQKLRAHTGWQPEIPIETTLSDLFEYWMAHS